MNSALLKVDRAAKHIAELNSLFHKKRPFTYVLETNTKTGERATFAKRNEAITHDASIVIGDVIHNLRAALDHAYWEATNAFAKSEGERGKIQFPISKTKEAFESSVLTGLPSRVSPAFVKTLVDLKPYREQGGNQALCAVHDLDVRDKHKLLIPTGQYTRISGEIIKQQVPDMPLGGECAFGNCNRDVVWHISPMNRAQRRSAKVPASGILEQELNVPVDIVLSIADGQDSKPVIATLNELTDSVRLAVNSLIHATA